MAPPGTAPLLPADTAPLLLTVTPTVRPLLLLALALEPFPGGGPLYLMGTKSGRRLAGRAVLAGCATPLLMAVALLLVLLPLLLALPLRWPPCR